MIHLFYFVEETSVVLIPFVLIILYSADHILYLLAKLKESKINKTEKSKEKKSPLPPDSTLQLNQHLNSHWLKKGGRGLPSDSDLALLDDMILGWQGRVGCWLDKRE